MDSLYPRRWFLRAVGAAAILPSSLSYSSTASSKTSFRMPVENNSTPKICLGVRLDLNERGMKRVKQIGVNHVLCVGPAIPWNESQLRERIAQFRTAGLTLSHMMLRGFNDVISGGPQVDAQIENVVTSIRAAGKAGLQVIEYNLYTHRLMEGYKEEVGRGGAGYTAFQYDHSKHAVSPDGGTVQSRAQQLKRAERFLKSIIPEAEKANVRLAFHPNDPPIPYSRGSEQLVGSFEHWKEYLNLVKSPYNGMTFDCGVAREIGEDPVSVCRYLAERDCMNHVHFRNVVVRKPYVDYTEVFPDEGQVDMFAIMKELVRQKYRGAIYPEHPRGIDLECEKRRASNLYPGGGGFAGDIYNVAYARAMLQAALSM